MERRRLGSAGPYYDQDAADEHSPRTSSKQLSLTSERSRSSSPTTELVRLSSTALPITSELAYHHHYHQQHVDTSPALQSLSYPDHHHHQVRQQHRYQELPSQHYHHHHHEPQYQHYHYRYEPQFHHEHEHEQVQPLSPHVRPRLKLQSHLLPSVYHSPVTHSPEGSGLSTPRLPPISMLTAAASMQPRAPEPLQRQVSVGLASQHQQHSAVPMARGRAPAPLVSRVHRDDEQDNLCRYRNKRCSYPRAIKRNGDRHNLCEKHRAKANQNQRKLESKRRIQKRVPDVRGRDEQTGASLDAHHRDLVQQTHTTASVLLDHGALVRVSLPHHPPQSSYAQQYQDDFASY